MRSWNSAGHFILEAFGIIEFESAQPEGEVSVTPVTYVGDDGQELTGHLAMPGPEWERPLPAVVVFPDWDGVVRIHLRVAYACCTCWGLTCFFLLCCTFRTNTRRNARMRLLKRVMLPLLLIFTDRTSSLSLTSSKESKKSPSIAVIPISTSLACKMPLIR
jgi:hypothetical protein